MLCGHEDLQICHSFIPFVESDSLVSIDIQATHNSDDLGFTGSPTVHTTEIHDVVVVEETFAAVINRLESSHIRVVHTALELMLKAL